MHPLTIPPNSDFPHLIGACEEYAHPLRPMWTSFWLKAAAVSDGHTWHLCHFALIGRWSEVVGVEEVRAFGEALTAVSRRLDADEAWDLLDALVVDGTVPLTEDVRAVVPTVYVPPYLQWQEPAPQPFLSTTVDVVEDARWRWLYASFAAQWLNDTQAHFDLERRIARDLQRVGEPTYRRFISTHFGDWGEYDPTKPSFDMLQYCIDLPLALRMISDIPDTTTHTRPLTVACRSPLALQDVVITSGHRPTVTHVPLTLTDVRAAEDGWTIGMVAMPLDHDKVWIAHPSLYRTLRHEILQPSTASQTADVLAYINRPTRPNKGAQIRDGQVLQGRDDVFEVALLNALARFGIAVLFAGQLMSRGAPAEPDDGDAAPRAPIAPNKVGPATPGFDLVALDPIRRRAVLISAKSGEGFPGEREVEKLLKGVATVSRILDRWAVHGLIACHASSALLVRLRDRGDVRVWGQDELEALVRADLPESLERLLWTPPGWPGTNIFLGYQ